MIDMQSSSVNERGSRRGVEGSWGGGLGVEVLGCVGLRRELLEEGLITTIIAECAGDAGLLNLPESRGGSCCEGRCSFGSEACGRLADWNGENIVDDFRMGLRCSPGTRVTALGCCSLLWNCPSHVVEEDAGLVRLMPAIQMVASR